MLMHSTSLYLACVLIWGSTWFAIKFQLGVVAAEVSLVYRFSLAAIILLLFCLLTKRNLRFSPLQHVFIGLQGLFLFSANYLVFYWATGLLTSGIVALLFSTVILMNIVNGAIFLRKPIDPRVVLGALIMAVYGFFSGVPFDYDPSPSYSISLVYLSVFGSILAFGSYLTLIGRIGADKTAYAAVLFPIIALGISTLFEDYQWTAEAVSGFVFVLIGNYLVLKRPRAAVAVDAG